MNKTLIALAFLILILASVVANVVLAIFAPAQMATFNGAIITVLGVGSAGIVSIYGLGKQGQQLEQIKSQTNGTNTRLLDENSALRDENATLREQIAATGAVSTSEGRHEA